MKIADGKKYLLVSYEPPFEKQEGLSPCIYKIINEIRNGIKARPQTLFTTDSFSGLATPISSLPVSLEDPKKNSVDNLLKDIIDASNNMGTLSKSGQKNLVEFLPPGRISDSHFISAMLRHIERGGSVVYYDTESRRLPNFA